jgi:hypothetical protein
MFREGGPRQQPEEESYTHNREIGRDGVEVVRLGQAFPLFSPDRTTERFDPTGDFPDAPRYSSTVLLDTNGQSLPMEIRTFGCWHSKAQAFTPFDPSVGYRVSIDDFDGQSRLAKLRGPDYQTLAGIPGAPLTLYVCIGEEAKGEPESMSSIRDLRLQLTFPAGMRLEARPEERGLREGDVRFSHGFYPLDTGQLAVPTAYEHHIFEGLDIALPANRHDLEHIGARFTLEGRHDA